MGEHERAMKGRKTADPLLPRKIKIAEQNPPRTRGKHRSFVSYRLIIKNNSGLCVWRFITACQTEIQWQPLTLQPTLIDWLR